MSKKICSTDKNHLSLSKNKRTNKKQNKLTKKSNDHGFTEKSKKMVIMQIGKIVIIKTMLYIFV